MNGFSVRGCLALVLPVLSVLMALADCCAYDELMPVPQRVERRSAQVPLSALEKVTVRKGVVAGVPENVAEESYALDIAPDGVVITAPTEKGVRYAKTTLGQLGKLAAGSSDIPSARIVDWPKFRWRGFMPDTARNYLPVKSLKALIDVMAAYKLNLLHWHLTEHYGWRLESKKYPELHAPKAFLNRHPGKYYTQEEFREVVDYAWERGIAVMPELDVPGHATAFRQAFGMKNMDNPRATEIIEDLFRELCTLTSVEKTPFVHMGTDEVWNKELEGARPESISRWAKAVTDSGRQVVSWDPGQAYEATNRVAMLWGGRAHAGGGRPAFDANGMYIETFDPFELLPHGTYHAQFWEATAPENRLGAIFCGWHDGFVGENYDNVFRNEQIVPCCVLYGNNFWNGPKEDSLKYRTRLPLAGDPLLARAVEIERRVVAQRDKVLRDLPYPFQFVAQTHMRWRLTNERGELVAKDIAQATISPRKDPKSPGNFTEATNGTMIAETWIRSPRTQAVGAWIGFLGMDRDHGLERLAGGGDTTPRLGEWNIVGATAELNGEKIAPPEWKRPGLRKGKVLDWCPVPWWYELGEEPYTDQEYFMREPTPITLRKGWNHVRLTAPCPGKDISWSGRRWIMTFCPVLGSTDHPREVSDLVYSSDPPNDCNGGTRKTRCFMTPHVQPAPRHAEWKLDRCVELKDGIDVLLGLDAERNESVRWLERQFGETFKVSARVQAGTESREREMEAESYRLRLDGDGIRIDAHGLAGVRHAFQTLRQMAMPKRGTLKVEGWIAPACDITDAPSMKFRGMHLCWFPETDVRLVERCIRLAGYYKMNAVVLETWGTFRSERHPWLGWRDGRMTKAEIRRLRGIADNLGVTLIPQVNVFGHASMSRGASGKHAVLDLSPEYQALYEPGGWNWCLSNPSARQVIDDLVTELHEAFGSPPYFHIGCDEAGEPRCPDCRAADYVKLVADHVTHVAKLLESRHARAMMWHDMLLRKGEFKPFYANAKHGEERMLGELPKSIVICDWFYDDHVQTNYPTFKHFRDAGHDVLTCPWENGVTATEAMAKALRTAGGLGLLGTTWHHAYRNMIGRQFVASAAAAWGASADSYDFDEHWRQMGWDTGVRNYGDCGYATEQIPSSTNPEVVPRN